MNYCEKSNNEVDNHLPYRIMEPNGISPYPDLI